MVNVFAAPVFFICFRESLECAIIVSVLLAFLKQTIGPDRDPHVYKKLKRQIWFGVGVGIVVCLCVGAGMIGAWQVKYGFGKDHFASTEDIWEGSFSLLATIIISVVGIGLLRVSKLTDKWRVKIAQALEKHHKNMKIGAKGRFQIWCHKYAMVLLPLVTVLREGLEAVVFIGGVGLTVPATAFPIAVITGLAAGAVVGYVIYRHAELLFSTTQTYADTLDERFGNSARLQVFLIASTCFLYLIAAGLFSKSVWYFENYAWAKAVGGDAAETGSGPGSYNIWQSVWHVNCCNPLLNGGGGWGVFNSLFGWQNSATYGSVISYNLYWLTVIVAFGLLGFYERRGHWPFQRTKLGGDPGAVDDFSSSEGIFEAVDEKSLGPDGSVTVHAHGEQA